ncbi:DUF2267 domain-containing protein [candidate division GN15 bacterium]|nr:DUF2267 domain-containing protein [candidate division GN15 bacterium]
MQFHDFIGQVQHRARLDSEEAALKLTRVTLETLSERLGGEEPRDLAAQLPEEIGRYLTTPGKGERFNSDEFLQRVSEREGADLPKAVYHVRAVFEVLGEAVSGGELNDVRQQLPEDYHRLFEAGTSGDMPNA